MQQKYKLLAMIPKISTIWGACLLTKVLLFYLWVVFGTHPATYCRYTSSTHVSLNLRVELHHWWRWGFQKCTVQCYRGQLSCFNTSHIKRVALDTNTETRNGEINRFFLFFFSFEIWLVTDFGDLNSRHFTILSFNVRLPWPVLYCLPQTIWKLLTDCSPFLLNKPLVDIQTESRWVNYCVGWAVWPIRSPSVLPRATT